MTEEFTCDNELAAIARGIIELTLPKARWTHRAHFAVAFWLLERRPDLDVAHAMPGLIRAYNEATGVANTDTSGYHETITLASLRVARAFLRVGGAGGPLYLIANALMRSPFGKWDWPLAYWSKERLFSVEARRSWIDPDVAPLPF